MRVIDDNGENLGVMFTREAIEQAAEVGLDLVEVSPNVDPPVCKFLDIGQAEPLFPAEPREEAGRAAFLPPPQARTAWSGQWLP